MLVALIRDLHGMSDTCYALSHLFDLHLDDLLLNILSFFVNLAVQNVDGLRFFVVVDLCFKLVEIRGQLVLRQCMHVFQLLDLLIDCGLLQEVQVQV